MLVAYYYNYSLFTWYSPSVPYAQQCYDYCYHHLAVACLLPLVILILFHWGNESLVPPKWFYCTTLCVMFIATVAT